MSDQKHGFEDIPIARLNALAEMYDPREELCRLDAHALVDMAQRCIAAERKLRVLECKRCGGTGTIARSVGADDGGMEYVVYDKPCPECGGDDGQ